MGQPELHVARGRLSMKTALGTAWVDVRSITLRVPMPASNRLGISTGQTAVQSPQAVHLSTSTKRRRRRTVALKLPASPSSAITSAMVNTSTLSSRMHSTSLGEMMQVAQSPVGKVLSSRAMPPPTEGLCSIM